MQYADIIIQREQLNHHRKLVTAYIVKSERIFGNKMGFVF